MQASSVNCVVEITLRMHKSSDVSKNSTPASIMHGMECPLSDAIIITCLWQFPHFLTPTLQERKGREYFTGYGISFFHREQPRAQSSHDQRNPRYFPSIASLSFNTLCEIVRLTQPQISRPSTCTFLIHPTHRSHCEGYIAP